ncbi:hypothetical protein RvY_01803 [Ramazzottius varieornatus]|uniref:Uncharacterized protein n=1 Tax=Ramazzottius varieornatus TaxID=947166 RepID=A0A1D1UHR9_RAMVA|nr:hypothetical protein RvY_01803 [Ramazzottius varieornatus]
MARKLVIMTRLKNLESQKLRYAKEALRRQPLGQITVTSEQPQQQIKNVGNMEVSAE